MAAPSFDAINDIPIDGTPPGFRPSPEKQQERQTFIEEWREYAGSQ